MSAGPRRVYNGPVLPLLRIVGLVALLLVALVAVAFLAQRRLLYFPTRYDLAAATGPARQDGLEPWLDHAGAFVGWRAPHPGGAPVARAIVLHGNAGTALDRTYLRDVLQAPGLPPLDVHLMEYPGLRPPGRLALRGVHRRRDRRGHRPRSAPDLPVLLVGESLGSAAAALAAAERPKVAGLLLITPVSSVTALARRHYPFVPSGLVRDAFRADRALPRYGGRVAFLLAGRDEVAPPDLARALFEAYPGPKRLWEEPGATHNTLPYRPGDPLWSESHRLPAGLHSSPMTALARFKSPVGTLSVEATDDGVCSVRFGGRDGVRPPISKKTRHNLEAGLQALADYFSGHPPLLPAPRPARHRAPAHRLGGPAGHPLGRDRHLR